MVSDTSRRNVLFASAMGSSLAPFMVSGLLVALPTIGVEFGADASLLGWLTNAFFLAAAVALVPFGRLADLHGAKKVFTTGVGVYVISVILCILAPTIQWLIAARFLTGIGAGMVFGTSIALLSLVFPESERGKAIGVNVTAMSVGFLLGFFLGGLFTFYTGWRSIFLVTIPIELAVIGMILARIRGECEITRERQSDIPGIVSYSSALLLIVVGFSTLPRTMGMVLLVLGLIVLVLFVLQERRLREPLIRVEMFWKNTTFGMANLAVLLFNISNFAIIFVLTLYLQSLRMFDSRIAGTILLIPIVFIAVFSAFAGRLSDRIAPRNVIGSGIGFSSLSLLIFAFLNETTPLIIIIFSLILAGLGIAFCQPPLVRTSVSSVPKSMYGIASGMIETMRLVGMTIGIAITVILFTFFVGNRRISPDVYPLYITSIQVTFWLFLGISLVALLITLLFLKRS
ncbi:MAG: MFS transporter, partial [Methanomicrobiales archaeon]|nr:MFS transporter [Methanomicrobiales archaeon]